MLALLLNVGPDRVRSRRVDRGYLDMGELLLQGGFQRGVVEDGVAAEGDERLVRIHKRIEEENQKREQPIISAHEYEIAENLSQMKSQIDNMLFLNINVLDNEDAFKRDVLAIIGRKLIDLGIKANLTDRKYINNLITTEYFQQRNFAY